jgi:dephospho-CoA kinase
MIIGITGKLKSGKTTVAELLSGELPKCYILAYADILKDLIFESGLCTREELWGEKTDFSRLMMQKIGTNIIRKIDKNYFIKTMESKIENIIKENGKSA